MFILTESKRFVVLFYMLHFDIFVLSSLFSNHLHHQKQGSEVGAKSPSGGSGDRASYQVFHQPLAMDRFTMYDITHADASGECEGVLEFENVLSLPLFLDRPFGCGGRGGWV